MQTLKTKISQNCQFISRIIPRRISSNVFIFTSTPFSNKLCTTVHRPFVSSWTVLLLRVVEAFGVESSMRIMRNRSSLGWILPWSNTMGSNKKWIWYTCQEYYLIFYISLFFSSGHFLFLDTKEIQTTDFNELRSMIFPSPIRNSPCEASALFLFYSEVHCY